MTNDAIRQRLDRLVHERGDDYATLSRMLGRNQTYIQQFIKRGVPRKLDEDDRRKLAEHFGVSEQELGGPPGPVGRAVHAGVGQVHDSQDYVLIPRLDVGASAGHGSLPGDEDAQSALAFQARWARSIASGGVEALSVIRVEGDSMYPTLSNGDQILVDAADKRVRDGIFVLRTDGALHVKRVSVNPTSRRLSIRSDNPVYPAWEDCDPASIDIIGRVVWVGRKL
ncbi:S24 family peptidase [Parapedomonas caeni]